ncbi:hypothetical protein Cgig2_012334 [Carnegiea gigantea]|uniref:Uncharacterized protein n=1 Tax=Carnegiea gigantea TaxID=171969 RepID=A0A9Q1JQH9_9CARY|nr:hypothetical protein Cgig2_012334 [Carnegiea gigantea]
MLLNEAERRRALHGRALRTLESALTDLRWSTFESWVWLYGDRIFEALFQTKAAPKEKGSEVEPKGEGSASEERPPLLTMTNRGEAIEPLNVSILQEEAVQRERRQDKERSDSKLQAPRGEVKSRRLSTSVTTSDGRRGISRLLALGRFRRTTTASVLGVAMQYACDSNTPEMVQIIFYAMVIDDAAELGLSCKLNMDYVMWAMRKLDWGPVEAWLGDNDRRP